MTHIKDHTEPLTDHNKNLWSSPCSVLVPPKKLKCYLVIIFNDIPYAHINYKHESAKLGEDPTLTCVLSVS